MAAFINALAEEGTAFEIKDYIFKQRKENYLDPVPANFYDGWDRRDLIDHLVYLWDSRPAATLADHRIEPARLGNDRRFDVV